MAEVSMMVHGVGRYHQSWRTCLDEEWKLVLWTDADVEAFVLAEAPKEYLRTYSRFGFGVFW